MPKQTDSVPDRDEDSRRHRHDMTLAFELSRQLPRDWIRAKRVIDAMRHFASLFEHRTAVPPGEDAIVVGVPSLNVISIGGQPLPVAANDESSDGVTFGGPATWAALIATTMLVGKLASVLPQITEVVEKFSAIS